VLTDCLSVNSTFRINEAEPDIECYVEASVCHESFTTTRLDGHNPLVEAAFGNIVVTKEQNCDASVAYTITMCLLSSVNSQPVAAPVTCYDYDSTNSDDYLASGTTSAADGCIALTYDASG